jgi:hypothetical protein
VHEKRQVANKKVKFTYLCDEIAVVTSNLSFEQYAIKRCYEEVSSNEKNEYEIKIMHIPWML